MFAMPRRYAIEVLTMIALATLLVAAVSFEWSRQRAALYSAAGSSFGEVRDRLHVLSELTSRNDAHDAAMRIVTDCPERTLYEAALEKLASASPADLASTAALHDACGDFFALRKRVMVREMELAHAELGQLAVLLNGAGDRPLAVVDSWDAIIKGESKRRDLLNEQVDLQERIIEALRNRDRKATEPLSLRAKEIAEELAVTHQEIQNLRSAEISIWEGYTGR